jgi:alkanesulfonate monooxygenase SsuD/methylene tetrahydromethanopterin reductase-like flavin-dependent oxidoreductase (luciferase family)
VAWACGLLAKTERLTVFGTVHAPLIPPLIAAKEFVTADHIGEGLVCGWNEGEFEMFGATLRDHEARYEYAQWLDIVKLAWSPHEDFDFDGRFIKLKGVRAKPKPYGGTRPLIMNASASPTGQAFAIRNCDALFSTIPRGISFEETAGHVSSVQALIRQAGRKIDVYTVGVVTCRGVREELVVDHRRLIAVAPFRVARSSGRVLDHGNLETLFEKVAQMGFDADIRQHPAEEDFSDPAFAQLQDQIVGLRPPDLARADDDRFTVFDIRLEPVQPVSARAGEAR